LARNEAKQPSVGIFWAVQRSARETRPLSTGCSLEAAEPYGDFRTFPDGHYNVSEVWRTLRDPDAALRALVRTFEYEDWPRGRIVFDQMKKLFILYADRKLMLPDTITQIQARFALSPDKTIVETDFHYQCHETPGPSP
jgi:hypothetical protein